MKKTNLGGLLLYLCTAVMGLEAMYLQVLAGNAYDVRGLYLWDHPAARGLMWVSGMFLVSLLLLVSGWVPREETEQLRGQSWVRGSLTVLGALLLGMILLDGWAAMPGYQRLLWMMGSGAMLLSGIGTMLGKRSGGLFPALVCLFLLIWLLIRYRTWAGSAHIEQYVFALLGGICVMLFSYQCSSADAGMLHPQKLAGLGLAGLFFLLVTLADPTERIFHISMILWVLGGMCRLTPAEQNDYDDTSF